MPWSLQLLQMNWPRVMRRMRRWRCQARLHMVMAGAVFMAACAAPQDQRIHWYPKESRIVFLGTPIGNHQFNQDFIRSKLMRVNDVTNRTALLKDAHMNFVLLLSCLALPKIMSLLRTEENNQITIPQSSQVPTPSLQMFSSPCPSRLGG